MRKVIIGNHAAAYGVKLSRAEVIAAYPITPQTQIVELLSEMCGNGELKAVFLKVESEHSALASLIGASSTGARAFTATSSQGLALMHELIHWASGARLPIVMANVNRALAPGWNIWADQTDSLSERDTGWMQIYCETGQEILDLIIMSYKLAERVKLPIMITYDAFYLSHTAEPVDIPEQKKIDRFLPSYGPDVFLNVDNPATLGALARPEHYMEMRYNVQKSLETALPAFNETAAQYYNIVGRKYDIVDTYKLGDADTVVICASTMASATRIVIDDLRKKGKKIGLLKLRFFRPFPFERIRKLLKGRKQAIVMDRNLSPGMGGIFAQEIRNALYGTSGAPKIKGVVVGLGGKDITPDLLMEIIAAPAKKTDFDSPIVWKGLNEQEQDNG